MVALSVVVPLLDDGPALARLLGHLADARCDLAPEAMEIVVADGGSSDDGVAVALAHRCTLVHAPRGRGAQLAAGVAASRGSWIWMLHADAVPSREAVAHLLARSDPQKGSEPAWGRFDVAFDEGVGLAVVAFMMNRRSCLTGFCTGDQGIFAHRDLIDRAGGVPVQPLMEDIELCRRLKACAQPQCRRETVVASARRWHRDGLVRTVLSMWRWRLRYWLGADPARLAAEYYRW
jgi:rSAM/selenodomain-associated transferase 2